MIVVRIDSSRTKEYVKKLNSAHGSYKPLKRRLQGWIAANPMHADLIVVRHIKDNLTHILSETPKGLEAIIIDFTAKGFQSRIFNSVTRQPTAFGEELKKLFNYKGFRNSKKALWLAKGIPVKCCTTCSTQYTLTTVRAGEEKMLFHLDHYFPQSVYPYLSLSYYNLIPSCGSCNMGKSNKAFTLLENIHPYIESFHDLARFKLDKSSIVNFLTVPGNDIEKITYEVSLRARYVGDPVYERKLVNYLREYRINEQYKQFKDIAGEIILRSKYYHKARRKELRKFFEENGLLIEDEFLKRLIIGNYHRDSDLLRRPLAKFMRDIGEDLGMI
jgi:hypothetical protein